MEIRQNSEKSERRLPATADQQSEGGQQVATDLRNSQDKTMKPFSFYASLLCLALLALIVAWDTTALAVAIPVIAEQLHATTLEAFFASIAFTLAVAVSQPLYLSISDAVGRKVPLYVAMVLFTVGSILFAVARSITVLIVGRLIQGLGGGGLDILQEIIIVDMTSLKERPAYLAVMALPIALGSIMGPIIGALLCQFVTWRWLGWINLPFVGPAIPLALMFMHLRPIDLDLKTKFRRLDWRGMFMFTVGAICVSLPVSWADTLYPWSSWKTILPLVVGIIAFITFGFYEARPAQPMLPYRLFKNRTAVVSIIGGSIHGLLLFSLLLYLPLFFQAVYLQTPLESAISILPACVVTVAFSVFAPVCVEFTRRYTLLLHTGWVTLTLFIGLWCIVDQTSSKAVKDTFLVFIGIGLGTVFQTIPFPLQASVEEADDSGRLVGLLVITRFLGGVLGLAIGSSVFNSGFAHQIAAFGPLPIQVSQLSDPRQAIGFIPMLRTLSLDTETMSRLTEAYRIPFRTVWIVLASISGVGLVTSLLTKQLNLEKEDLGRQRFDDS
ncbi:MFS general substrate transporter [Annulohypoxylon truncatum]|uniref:MFS general substrate transporter n=1 Tax=Annulohypoxylon truncatum TaxID=327061 RepID=UPI0020087DD2|nr:MFS general substrate transporter [Annulohypoxylon truncatum]KAI1206361.1 MFS general substrate transporter [Annulohypoxylon truncatum]